MSIYIKKTYGNCIDFTGSCRPKREREHDLDTDKNMFVRTACRLRLFKKQIKTFDGYERDAEQGKWIIDVYATRGYHRMLQRLLRNPMPTLEKWKKQDERREQKLRKRIEKRYIARVKAAEKAAQKAAVDAEAAGN